MINDAMAVASIIHQLASGSPKTVISISVYKVASFVFF